MFQKFLSKPAARLILTAIVIKKEFEKFG